MLALFYTAFQYPHFVLNNQLLRVALAVEVQLCIITSMVIMKLIAFEAEPGLMFMAVRFSFYHNAGHNIFVFHKVVNNVK